MRDTCSRTLPARSSSEMTKQSPTSLSSRATSLHVRVLRSNSKLPKTMLTDLPDELLIYLLKFLPMCDLQNMYRISKQFKWLLDSTPRIWANASVVGRWPSNSTEMECFNRVAELGNLEALIKLGVAYLYSEGVESSLCKDGSRAAKYFSSAEKLAPCSSPFTWLLIRPPWSNCGTCCKARVFQGMKDISNESKEADRSVLFCLAKLHSFIEDMDPSMKKKNGHQSESRQWLKKAADAGSVAASYEYWKNSLNDSTNDHATNLNILRQLREFASQGCLEAKLRLYSEYAKGKLGGVSQSHAREAMRGFVKESQPTKVHTLLRSKNGLNSAMRYILVDWLVEVGSMKDYSCLTIHSAVQLVDRYLMARNISRSTLQLVGITCMVICSRLLEDDIITIREAAWLTDGTYKYEDVVRMLGDVVATLKGNLRELTILDYLHLFCQVVSADSKMEYLALYISELSLLHADFGQYSRALIAACSLFLARLVLGADFPWPTPLVEHTGFEICDLVQCTLHLHNKCFLDDPVKDHRDVTLAAVKQRFSEDLFLRVGELDIMVHPTLRTMLCVEEDEEVVDEEPADVSRDNSMPSSKDGMDAFLLMSPSRKSRGQMKPNVAEYLHDDRSDRVSTPTHEFPEDEDPWLGVDVVPFDISDSDINPQITDKPREEAQPKNDSRDHVATRSSASWVILDESQSVSVRTRTSHPSSTSSKGLSLTSGDIPSTSNCFLPLSTALSSSSSSLKSKSQVTYTISASGRLCQQKVKARRVGGSPVSSRSRSVPQTSSLKTTPSKTVRYQFRQRTPVQSVKRKSMEDSSDEGAAGH
ncbi:cyclin-F [Strongylocentrotus purpuratus]|uniref:Cyclin-F n=1 Tax=Strongylocentrotus purpuratus TaxID=7668 RepID=A0A7M7HDY2_STRPU|nr:cyclin-F [Strongylocentrotus purpuratus]|eukprot:XP_011666474.1 PREDICTED: cyclin-F-like isoform X3 [Strongylocentrotus purpuratus]